MSGLHRSRDTVKGIRDARLGLEQQNEQDLTSNHSSLGGFGDRRACLRLGARNCSPYCRTIPAAGFRRIPTAPRPSTKAHSAAIRLTTSSAVNIGGIPLHLQACAASFPQAMV